MPYTLDFTFLAPAAGYTDLRAQLYDMTGANVGAAISAGFVDLGSGYYNWHSDAIPMGHRGGVRFYRLSDPTTILADSVITPEDFESLVSIAAIQAGDPIAIRRDSTTTIIFTGLGNINTRTKLYFSIKGNLQGADSSALIQIEETGGLLFLNGAAAVTPGNASLSVTDAILGNGSITLAAALTAALPIVVGLKYDFKMMAGTRATMLMEGAAAITAGVTRAIT